MATDLLKQNNCLKVSFISYKEEASSNTHTESHLKAELWWQVLNEEKQSERGNLTTSLEPRVIKAKLYQTYSMYEHATWKPEINKPKSSAHHETRHQGGGWGLLESHYELQAQFVSDDKEAANVNGGFLTNAASEGSQVLTNVLTNIGSNSQQSVLTNQANDGVQVLTNVSPNREGNLPEGGSDPVSTKEVLTGTQSQQTQTNMTTEK